MNALTHSPAAAGAFTRQDVRFDSGETYCSAWLYLPVGVERPPVVVLGHGSRWTMQSGCVPGNVGSVEATAS